MVAFGSPKIGLQEILGKEGITATSVFDMFLNTIPHQETLTVRTEEAIAITLATLNLLKSM
jgi:predicted SPOUT superfamily RNA methylase MTH1